MSTAASARPLLCEKSGCGGKGAREYSEKYVKECRDWGGSCEFRFIEVSGCMKNTQHGAQWDCWGKAWEESSQIEFTWHVWVGEYGEFKYATYE
jgi:hypothetical protein